MLSLVIFLKQQASVKTYVLGAHKNCLIGRDASFEYPQHMFCLRYDKINLQLPLEA